MRNNSVELRFDKTMTRVAGFIPGKKCFENQVKGRIVFTEDFTLIIPSHIERFATSFVQGFFSEIKSEIGIVGIKQHMNIESSNPHMKEDIIEKLYGF